MKKNFLLMITLLAVSTVAMAQETNEFGKPFTDGLIAVESSKTGKWGFTDLNGNLVISCKWDYARDFGEGLAAVRDESTWK